MYRATTQATVQQIAALEHKPAKPAWLKSAVSDAVHNKPMSLERERRMCEALGITPPLAPVEVEPCPIHGIPHVAGPCSHNGTIAAVVVLREGEAVTQRKPPRQSLPELARIMRAFSQLQPRPVSGGSYDSNGRRR